VSQNDRPLRMLAAAMGLAALWLSALVPVCRADDDDEGYVELYTGYGTPEGVLVHGRALEDAPPKPPKGKGSHLGNLVRTVKLLETDELENRALTVTCVGRNATGRTDKEGMFRIRVEAGEKPFKVGELSVQVSVQASRKKTIKADGKVLVFPSDVPLVIVCDFDDTICRTGMKHKLGAATRTVTGDPSRMKPVTGMSDALKALQGPQDAPRPVIYVSGGPVNLHPRITEFMARNGFPVGPVILRNLGIGQGNDSLSTQTYKTGAIEGLMKVFGKSRFVLIGDSGEKDPEIYAALRKAHPDRVSHVFIRLVGKDQGDEKRLEGMTTFRNGDELLRAVPTELAGPSAGKDADKEDNTGGEE